MKNARLVQELKGELIRNYEKYVRFVVKLADVHSDDAREALHRAVSRMLVDVGRRPAGRPILAWRRYIVQAAVNQLSESFSDSKGIIRFGELSSEERRQLLSIADPRPTPLEQAEMNELASLAWAALGALPSYERQVIARRCQGESFHEIADLMGIQPSTARGFWTTGIARLRVRFGVAA